jgi:hypothetical protein
MKESVTVAPPNSIIFVMDFKNGKLPKSIDGGLIATSPSSVVIGTYPEPDGETTIILTDDVLKEIGSEDMLAFDGSISVPGRRLSVVTVHDEALLSIPTQRENVHLRVWVNHPQCPSRIIIVAH